MTQIDHRCRLRARSFRPCNLGTYRAPQVL